MIEGRIQRVGGATVLYDAGLPGEDAGRVFDEEYWDGRSRPLAERTGRGAVQVLESGAEEWVLRHYRRGGLVSRFVDDHYVWSGLERTRSFREWRLLARLHALGLPVPRPVAARVRRAGLLYRADIITAYLPGTRPLSALLDDGRPPAELWRSVGRMLRAFHDSGVEHPDLTAHNILLDDAGRVFLVDFDNAHIRAPGAWREAGLARLQRSLRKVALETGTGFDDDGWRVLEQAYRGDPRPAVQMSR